MDDVSDGVDVWDGGLLVLAHEFAGLFRNHRLQSGGRAESQPWKIRGTSDGYSGQTTTLNMYALYVCMSV